MLVGDFMTIKTVHGQNTNMDLSMQVNSNETVFESNVKSCYLEVCLEYVYI